MTTSTSVAPSSVRWGPLERIENRQLPIDSRSIEEHGAYEDVRSVGSDDNEAELPNFNSLLQALYRVVDSAQSRMVEPTKQALTVGLAFLKDVGHLMALLGPSTSAGSDANHIKVDIKSVERELKRLKETWGAEIEFGPEPLEDVERYAKEHGCSYVNNLDGTGVVLKENPEWGPAPLDDVKRYATEHGLSYRDNHDGTGVVLKGKVVFGPAPLSDIERYAEKWRLPYKINADGTGVVLVDATPIDRMLREIADEKPGADGKVDWLVGRYQAWNTTMTTQYQQIESNNGLLGELARNAVATFNNIYEAISSMIRSIGDGCSQATRGIA